MNISDANSWVHIRPSLLKAFLVIILAIFSSFSSSEAARGRGHGERKLALENPGFISIDCGATADYDDVDLGIHYSTDSTFTDSGIDKGIQFHPERSNNLKLTWNVRSFPVGKRNCYTLKPSSGKNNTYLIRAVFMYGNYDLRDQLPQFDLYIGVNFWVTVQLHESFKSSEREAIYFSPTDSIDVCLVNIDLGVPFISGLELRTLDSSMYPTELGLLKVRNRSAVGHLNHYDVRYPKDVYDRKWQHIEKDNFSTWTPFWSNQSKSTFNNNDLYKVPYEVLSAGIEAENANTPLRFDFYVSNKYYSSSAPHSWIFHFHFYEIAKLLDGQQRKLRISTINGYSETFSLEYLKPLMVPSSVINGNDVYFSIESADGFKLPPILNALEFFEIVDLPLLQTKSSDIEAITHIKNRYAVIRNWQGDPCLPSKYLWEGLSCSPESPPRIISLNLSSINLSGEMDPSFGRLDAIQVMDLSFNELRGTVPEFFADLPNLKLLDLSGNNLDGPIPRALKKKVKHGKLKLRMGQNLCPKEQCEGKSKHALLPITVSALSFVIVILFCALTILWKKRHRDSREATSNLRKGGPLKLKNRPFRYSEILDMTENFKTVIGEGGFGKVYLGILEDGTRVAVKFLSESSKQGYKEFQAEAELLMVVHHKNLVHLIGYCSEGGNLALIYEYMVNGDLGEHLSKANVEALSWTQRLEIATHAANGLDYLHNGCMPPIVHRDLKTSNILLNENMLAKIADFGLSRTFSTVDASHLSTFPAGTPGYFDPEYQKTGTTTKKSDVYSFGVILLELITGRPAVCKVGPHNPNTHNIHIVDWVSNFTRQRDVHSLVDPRLHGEVDHESLWKAIELAMLCVLPDSTQRPDMNNLLVEIKGCLAVALASRNLTPWNVETMQINSSSAAPVHAYSFSHS